MGAVALAILAFGSTADAGYGSSGGIVTDYGSSGGSSGGVAVHRYGYGSSVAVAVDRPLATYTAVAKELIS